MDRARRAVARHLTLLSRLALVTFLVLGALGLVLGRLLQDAQRERTLGDAVHSAQVIANVGVGPSLQVSDLRRGADPLPRPRLAALDRALGSNLAANGIVGLEVWNMQRWIVYSTDEGLLGRWFTGDRSLDEALEGRTVSAITDRRLPGASDETDGQTVLAVYVPLRASSDSFAVDGRGEVVGALEVHLSYEPIAKAISEANRTIALTLVLGLAVLYLVVGRIAAGASKRLRRQADDAAHQASHDPLTGLPNRRYLSETTPALIEAAGSPGIALALVDLDRFKEINDTLGHVHGDEVLTVVAGRLRRAFDEDAVVARLGGDEFAVMVACREEGGTSIEVAQRIRSALQHPMVIDGVEIAVRASVGLAVAPDDGDDVETLLQRADVAMNQAKRTHSRYRRYERQFDTYTPERFRLAADIRRAIAAGEFELWYQPKIRFADRSVDGVEALVRWRHPERGVIEPADFLPLIENTELIGPLTYHLVDLALEQWTSWQSSGYDVPIAVNLSARTVLDPDLPARLSASLARHRAPASALHLELTESAVLADPAEAGVALGVLRQLGFQLAVDDFGTGYASLAYLMSLPLDVVKIDMSFARYVTTDPQAAAVVRFTVDLARHLGLVVVAEGVEDSATFEELGRLGCDLAQGFLISRPRSGPELTDWFRTCDHGVGRRSDSAGPGAPDADTEASDFVGASSSATT